MPRKPRRMSDVQHAISGQWKRQIDEATDAELIAALKVYLKNDIKIGILVGRILRNMEEE